MPTNDNRIKNNIFNMMLTGSKGNISNIKNMLAYIGFVLIDDEPLPMLYQGRMNPFFKRFDYDPRSYGLIMGSYAGGLNPSDLCCNAIPERVQLLKKVLSVSRAGAIGRKMRKNFETLYIANTRCLRKRDGIT